VILCIILQTHKSIIAANVKIWISLFSIACLISFRNDNFLTFDIFWLNIITISLIKVWLFRILVCLIFIFIRFFKCFFGKYVLLQSRLTLMKNFWLIVPLFKCILLISNRLYTGLRRLMYYIVFKFIVWNILFKNWTFLSWILCF
jgi:hypothetical protein